VSAKYNSRVPNTRLQYHRDRMGSIMAVSDRNGTRLREYLYRTYGQPRGGWSSASAVENAYLFTGARYDEAPGHYNLRNRYYHPRFGFISEDPRIRAELLAGMVPTDLNAYGYARGNPVR
jgi:RHS repeat-associated protein